MSTVLPCQSCGEPMPPLPDDLASLLKKGVAVTVVHEDCANPTGSKPGQEGRAFEVAVSIREIVGDDTVDPPGDAPPDVTVEELAAFRAGVRAADLTAAMRPLAEALGQEWMKVEKHAQIADPRA